MRIDAPSRRDRARARTAVGLQRLADGSLRVLRRVLFPTSRRPVAPARILVHLVGNIGDIAVSAPLLQTLARRYPSARIRLVTSAGRDGHPGAADLLADMPFDLEIEAYHVDEMKRPAALRAALRRWRRFDPDVMILCPPSLARWRHGARNLLFARLVGPDVVIGPTVPTIMWALDSQVRVRRWFPHESVRYGDLGAPLGVDAVERPLLLGALPAGSLDTLRELTPEGRWIAVCPGGKQLPHRWPAERFRAVVGALADADPDVSFVAVGSVAERELCADVLGAARGRSVVAAGRLTVRESAALLAGAALVITNDTGPMHLAAAADVPIVAVFGGAMPPGRWFPWAARAIVLRAEAACPQCLGRPDRPHCVERVTTEAVLAACRRALTAPGPATAAGTRSAAEPARCELADVASGEVHTVIEPTATGWREAPVQARVESGRLPMRS